MTPALADMIAAAAAAARAADTAAAIRSGRTHHANCAAPFTVYKFATAAAAGSESPIPLTEAALRQHLALTAPPPPRAGRLCNHNNVN